MAQRERLLDISSSARVSCVTRAGVDQSNVFRETLAAGEGKPLACLDGFDDITPLLEDDKSPFFAVLHGEVRELHCALELDDRMQHIDFHRALGPVSHDQVSGVFYRNDQLGIAGVVNEIKLRGTSRAATRYRHG